MGDFSWFGKVLIGIGGLMLLSGLVIVGLSKISGIGRLPGDIFINKGNFTFYFPLATCVIISIVLSLILNLFLRR